MDCGGGLEEDEVAFEWLEDSWVRAWVGYRDLQALAEGRGAYVLLSKSVWDSELVRLALKVVEIGKISVVYGFVFFLFLN